MIINTLRQMNGRRNIAIILLLLIVTVLISYQFTPMQYLKEVSSDLRRKTEVKTKVKEDSLASVGESSVLYYNNETHFIKNGRVFLKDDPQTIGYNPKQRAAAGYKFMKTLRVAIAGTSRSCRSVLSMMKSRLENLASLFGDHKFFFVENDSNDGTREYLLKWAKSSGPKIKVEVLGCGVNQPKCHIKAASGKHVPGAKLYPKHDYDIHRHRSKTMADLRNIYVERILNLSKSDARPFDFMIVIDFDLFFTYTQDGMARAFLHFKTGNPPFVDAVCCNGRGFPVNRVYDPCTIVFPPMSKSVPFVQNYESYRHINSLGVQIPREPGKWRPQKVLSCFQGLAIYRIQTIIRKNARYKGPPPLKHTCEHNMLAYQLDNIYVEPSLDVHVTMNASG